MRDSLILEKSKMLFLVIFNSIASATVFLQILLFFNLFILKDIGEIDARPARKSEMFDLLMKRT